MRCSTAWRAALVGSPGSTRVVRPSSGWWLRAVIVGIAEGRVVDVGSHDELMAARGFYHDLYISQFRGDATPTTV